MVISAKELHLAIKKGETTEDVAARHNITAEQLVEYINANMHAGASNLIRDLEKNSKIQSKKSRRKPKEEVSSITETEVEVVGTIIQTEDTSTSTVINATNLESLRKDEAELSDELCNLEKEHEEMVDQRRKIIASAQEICMQLIVLQKSLQEEEEKVKEFMDEYTILAEKMDSNTKERREYEAVLREIRDTMEELSKIVLIIKQDGTIECNHPEILDALSPEEEATELNRLMAISAAEDYTLKQLRAIARSKLISRIGGTVRSEISFEDLS